MTVSSNRVILKNTIFLYIRMFVTMLVSLLTVRVVFRTLGVVDYGVYNVIGGVVTSLAFLSDVLANASQRFFAVGLGKGDVANLKKTFNQLVLVYLFGALIILLLAESVGLWFVNTKMDIPVDRMAAANWVYQFAIMSFLVSLISSPYQSIIIAHERMNIYAYMSILDVVLKLLIVYFLVISPVDKLKLYAVLIFCVTLFNRLIYFVIARRKFEETKFELVWDKEKFRSIFSYSTWILIGSFSFMINTQGINILFNIFFGPIANASYAIGNQIKTTVNSFAANFFQATRPPIIKSYAQEDYVQTNKLFFFSSKIIFVLLFILIVPLFCEIEPILNLWLGADKVTEYMPTFVRLMLIYAVMLSMSEPITAIVQAAGEVKKYHGIVDVFTIITLPLSYAAFKLGASPYFGFFISIIVFVFAHIIRLLILRSFYSISLLQYTKTLICPILISISIVSIIMWFIIDKLNMHWILMIMISVFVASILSWIVVMNNEERSSVKNLIRSKIKK